MLDLQPRPNNALDVKGERVSQLVVGPAAARILQFAKFCAVGGSGTMVDMALLYFLASPNFFGIHATLAKICSAGGGMVNNFVWNELWTFRKQNEKRNPNGIVRRFLRFSAICGVGIGLAALFLHVLHSWLGWNLYLANVLTILIVTCWNFTMNTRFNWRATALEPR